MTLYLYKIPACRNQINSARIRMEYKCHLKRYPLEEYISLQEAQIIFPRKDFFRLLVSTNIFFGFQVKGNPAIYIHPGTFYDYLQKYYTRELKKVLKENTLKISGEIH